MRGRKMIKNTNTAKYQKYSQSRNSNARKTKYMYGKIKKHIYREKPHLPETKIASINFESAAEEWLEQAKLRIKISTFRNYEYLLKKHILPFFGNKDMSMITKHDMNVFIKEKLTNGRLKRMCGISKKYLKDILSIIKSIAAHCEQEYEIPSKIRYVTSPSVERKEMKVLDDKEYIKLTEYLMQKITLENTAVLISMFTGLRIGEVCGLKWDDFDSINQTITVRRTVQRISTGQGKTILLENSPKTSSSLRIIPIPHFICKLLLTFKRANNLPLFSHSEKYTEPSHIRKSFNTTLKMFEIGKMRFHDLRHSFASRCMRLNANIKTLSKILGHSNTSMTLNRYIHSSLDDKRTLMENFII